MALGDVVDGILEVMELKGPDFGTFLLMERSSSAVDRSVFSQVGKTVRLRFALSNVSVASPNMATFSEGSYTTFWRHPVSPS